MNAQPALGAFHNLRAARIAIGRLELAQLVLNQGQHLGRRRQQRLQAGDEAHEVLVLLFQFLPLQLRQPLERHVEDGLRLDFTQLKAFHQVGAGCVGGARTANDLDDLVQILERDQQAFDNVRTGTGAGQVELGAATHNFATVLDVVDQNFLQRQQARLAVNQRQQRDGECLLHGGQAQEFVEYLLGVNGARQFDDDAHPRAIRLIAQIGDALQPALTHQFGYAFEQTRLVGHVGQFGDDDAVAATAHLLQVRFGLDDETALADGVALRNQIFLFAGARSPIAEDQAAGGKIGALNELHQVFGSDIVDALVVVNQIDERIAHFAQVVRRHVG